MKSKLKQKSKKLLTIVMSMLMLIGMSAPSMQAFAKDTGGGAQTIHQVKFVTAPSDAKITVKDGNNKEIAPSKNDNNTYELNTGTYTYSASAEGYDSITDKSFKVEKSQDIKVELSKKNSSDSPVATMLKGNQPLKAGARGNALSLDDVKINSFKIIDVKNGNKEIDYRTSDSSDYASFSADPSKFSNALFEGQVGGIGVKLKVALAYKASTNIKEGDTLKIPMSHGAELKNFSSQKLFDGTNHELGIWEYKNGQIQIEFKGDYIKNNQVSNFTASFETGVMNAAADFLPSTSNKGERITKYGKIGKESVAVPYEKRYVKAATIGDTGTVIGKYMSRTSDKNLLWAIYMQGDCKQLADGTGYRSPYLLENGGQYSPKTFTNIYIEDTFENVVKAPKILQVLTYINGINDKGEVFSEGSGIKIPLEKFTEIKQGIKTKEEVKSSLQNGQYCIFNNDDET